MKSIFPILAVLSLAACGGGGSDGSSSQAAPPAPEPEAGESADVVDKAVAFTADRAGIYRQHQFFALTSEAVAETRQSCTSIDALNETALRDDLSLKTAAAFCAGDTASSQCFYPAADNLRITRSVRDPSLQRDSLSVALNDVVAFFGIQRSDAEGDTLELALKERDADCNSTTHADFVADDIRGQWQARAWAVDDNGAVHEAVSEKLDCTRAHCVGEQISLTGLSFADAGQSGYAAQLRVGKHANAARAVMSSDRDNLAVMGCRAATADAANLRDCHLVVLQRRS
ncbi:MAG: hypothetical protein R3236_08300 [Phycisphaeraceae bacterium]|nr:hypothetical protein [Phycisphaeraceae bacterium]